MAVLQQLLHPCPAQQFFQEIWQKRPQFISSSSQEKGNTENSFSFADNFFPLENLEELWSNVQQYQQQGVVGSSLEKEGTAALSITNEHQKLVPVTNPFFAAISHGCAILVRNAERFSHPLLHLCQQLETQGNFPLVSIHVCLTPRNHKDVVVAAKNNEGGKKKNKEEVLDEEGGEEIEDRFIVPIYGKREWRIFSSSKDESKKKREEVIAVASVGDVLYVPKGYPSEGGGGRNVSSSSSFLHLEISIPSSRWTYEKLVKNHISELLRRDTTTVTTSSSCLPLSLLTGGGDITNNASSWRKKAGDDDKVGDESEKEKHIMKKTRLNSEEEEEGAVHDDDDVTARAKDTFSKTILSIFQSEKLHDFNFALENFFKNEVQKCRNERDAKILHQQQQKNSGRRSKIFPLQLQQSTIMWNPQIILEERQVLEDDEMISDLSFVLHYCRKKIKQQQQTTTQKKSSKSQRKSSEEGDEDEEGGGSTMCVAVTQDVAKCLSFVEKHHIAMPLRVENLPFVEDDIVKLALGNFCLGNSLFIRVS